MSFVDRILCEADNALRTVAARPRARKPRPDRSNEHGDATPLSEQEQALSAALMRVNHAGEIAAQALYRGQAFVTRDDHLRQQLLDSAAEENDHLAWCHSRTEELGERTSLLAPVWYAGSFAIGAAAGLAGDRYSLGFLDETEQQVAEHLNRHLDRLPTDDSVSREIVSQMRDDEIRHGRKARELGGTALPAPVRAGMRALSKVMTGVSFRL
ncbi:MAG: 2-polyprenyl-3-methyl-6-methoxy-1,4-benzoquinone monooxygenase [Gammaproteobacteria bacterium]|nr:2-polyprenyl-3-methyl-6-methoxy-1,4-benzoquinone monooxygenase [Gammaproteobacteria bacterium]NND53391.1 2-polyprenyl-3-methyl-6-methoxy-1,4-benzoquinone monooxygenase [Gammaproteobacteria bacterium]